MATDALTKAILQGLDPGTYRSLSDLEQGNALQQVGQDASPTSKWGAIGRLANAAAGTYIQNSATSDLAKTLAGGKKDFNDRLIGELSKKQVAPVPTAPPASAPLQPSVQQAVPPSPFPSTTQPTLPAPAPNAPEAGTPNAAVANRFPGDPAFMQSAQYQPPAAPEAQPAADGTTAVAAIDKATQPRGIRNNNALNIEDGPFAKSQPGYAGSDGRFAKFQTPEHGTAAASALLDSYDKNHGLNTVAGIVNRWAPPTDGNNTMAYATDVAGKLGIDPNAPVPPALRPQLIAAMAQHENGKAAPGTVAAAPGAPVQLASAAPTVASDADPEAPAAKGQQIAQAGDLDVNHLLQLMQHPYANDESKALISKLILQQLTPKEDEFASSPQGIYNKRTGDLKQGGNSADDIANRLQAKRDSGASRQDMLQEIPAQYRDYTAALLDGKAVPANMGRGVDRAKVISYAHAIDGNFDETTIPTRIAMRKDFSGEGKNGLAIGSFNTVQHHLDKLSDDVEGLAKFNGDYPTLNSARTWLANKANTNPPLRDSVQAVNDDLAAVSHEVGNAYNSGHLSDHDMATWNRLTNSDLPPDQLRRGISDFTDLLNGKRDSLNHMYRQTFGDDAPAIEKDKNEATTSKIHQRLPEYAGNKGNPTTATPTMPAATPGTPDRSAVEAEMRKRGLMQ